MSKANLASWIVFFCITFFFTFVSCEKKEEPAPALREECGLGGMFAQTEIDGPCDRCRTEAGFIRMGREGQLCWDPSKRNSLNSYQMVLFTSNPADWWPSDTLYRSWQYTPNGFILSSVVILGQATDGGGFKPPHCVSDPVSDDFWKFYGNDFEFAQLRTSDGDSEIENGETFSGRFRFSDFNNDCWPEFGVVTGYMERDTAFGEVIWRTDNMVGIPLELVGDTVATSSFIMVDPPEWLR